MPDKSPTIEEANLYKALFPTVSSAATAYQALMSARAIAQLDQLADSDFLQTQFVLVLLKALEKPCGWPTSGEQDEQGVLTAQLRAAQVLSEGARYGGDVQTVLLLTTPILRFSGFQGSGAIAIRMREIHAQALADSSGLAISTQEATELATRIGRPDYYRESEFLQIQIGRCLLAAASVEERPETLSRIGLLFEKLPSLPESSQLLEMRAQIATVAGTRVQSAQEQRAHHLANTCWATEPFHDSLFFASAIGKLSRYQDSSSIQSAHALALVGGLRDVESPSILRDAVKLLMDNPEFWRDRAIQDRYLQIWHKLWSGPAQITYDGLCADRYFDSDVLYDSSYEVVESPLKKILVSALKHYLKEPRALLREQAKVWLKQG